MRTGTLGCGTAAAIMVALLATGCTPDSTPPTTPTPTAIQTPAETEQERQQREAYAAAETAYRTFRAEYGRVLRAGGSKEATAVMTETAGGRYLVPFVEAVQAYRGLGSYDRGTEITVYVRQKGYSSSEISLEVCEDSRNIRTYTRAKKLVGTGGLIKLDLEVQNRSGRWKVWSGKAEKVTTCG